MMYKMSIYQNMTESQTPSLTHISSRGPPFKQGQKLHNNTGNFKMPLICHFILIFYYFFLQLSYFYHSFF